MWYDKRHMIKKSKKSSPYKDMTLHGYKIRIFKDRVVIENKDKLMPEQFKPISMRLAQYLIDEMFVIADELRVEMCDSL